MDKDGKPLSCREKVSFGTITAGAGLLGGVAIWSLPVRAHLLCGIFILLLLWFLGPGTWFALLGRFAVRGPERPAFVKYTAPLLNLTAVLTAAALFWVLRFWRPPWH